MLQALKKLIFIAAALFVIVYFYNLYTTKIPEGPPKAQKTPETIEAPVIPENSDGVEREVRLAEPGEEQKILSFDMTGYTEDGRKKWDLRGKSADIISDTVLLNDIVANAYSEDRTVELTANSGKYDKKENSIRLEDNVIVITSDGVHLKADWFKWNSMTDEIITDSFVEVEKDNLYASGYGAAASTENKEVQLNKDIIVKQDEMTITCGGPLIIDYEGNKASFYDRVKAIEPRGELLADRLDVFFNPDSRKMENVAAEGNVELKRGENIAKGQRIIYTVASGEAILTGNPEIVIYSKKDLGDAFTGD